jgi:hypothetical protein
MALPEMIQTALAQPPTPPGSPILSPQEYNKLNSQAESRRRFHNRESGTARIKASGRTAICFGGGAEGWRVCIFNPLEPFEMIWYVCAVTEKGLEVESCSDGITLREFLEGRLVQCYA